MTRRERSYTFGNGPIDQQDSLLTEESTEIEESLSSTQSESLPFYNRIPCFKPLMVFLLFQVIFYSQIAHATKFNLYIIITGYLFLKFWFTKNIKSCVCCLLIKLLIPK